MPREKVASPETGTSPKAIGHRSLLTTVKEGETLEDVTIRVYGSSELLDMLWRANRNILPAWPLPEGGVRTSHAHGMIGFQILLQMPAVAAGRSLLRPHAEVNDVAVLDDVFLSFEPLQVLGLGFLERAGSVKLIVRR